MRTRKLTTYERESCPWAVMSKGENGRFRKYGIFESQKIAEDIARTLGNGAYVTYRGKNIKSMAYLIMTSPPVRKSRESIIRDMPDFWTSGGGFKR